MPVAHVNDLDICYDTFGSPDDPALLLVMGFTAQMTAWDDGFCQMIADRGFHVIRFDNRDCGLSTKFDGVEVDLEALDAARAGVGDAPPAPYSLSDMSDDGFALLSELGYERAHIVGASMGGMIVQTMAIEHPERVSSMTSIMSTTGNPEFFESSPEAMTTLLAPPPTSRDDFIEDSLNSRVWSSKRHFDPEYTKERAAASFDRSFYPEGAARQMAAIGATGDREEALRSLAVPTLVIHGRDDTLIMPSGGERTAELIDGAELVLVDDMGHDFPEPLWPELVDSIVGHAERSAG